MRPEHWLFTIPLRLPIALLGIVRNSPTPIA